MKIDLHIHTKRIKEGESKKLEISIEDFCQKMVENDIGIASITNHEKFDIEEYESIIKLVNENKYDFLLLPGVELDVYIEEKELKQLNLIFSNKADLINIKKIIDEYNKTKKYINDFIYWFGNIENIIFFIDHKRHDKKTNWWREEEVEKNLKNKTRGIIIFDSPNAKTHFVLQAKNINSLIGSDVKDWNEYEKQAEKLINIGVKIKDFDSLIKIIKYDNNTLEELKKSKEAKIVNNIELCDEEKNKIKDNITIYKGLNVIFGPKSSGKSSILKFIKNKNIKSVLYQSSNLDNEYLEFINNFKFEPDDYIKKHSKEISTIFSDICSYDDEIKYNPLIDLKYLIENPSEIKLNKILKFKECIDNENDKETKRICKELANHILKINNIIDSYNMKNVSKILDSHDIKYFNELKFKIIDNYKKINKFSWKNKFFKKLYESLQNVIISSTGKSVSHIELGLHKKWYKRKTIIDKIEKIKNIKYIKTAYKKHKEFNLKSRNEKLSIATKIEYLDFNDFNNSKDYLLKIKNGDDKKIKILNKGFSKKNWKNKISFSDNFKSIIQSILLEESQYFIKTKNLILNSENKSINLSNGEKAIFILFNILNNETKDVDYILLDEPDVYLSSENIIYDLIPKINEFKSQNKFIILATHNSILGINSIPFNMIYREKINDNEYITAIGNPWDQKFTFISENQNNKTVSFPEMLMEKFEGGKEHFNFRKDIYKS